MDAKTQKAYIEKAQEYSSDWLSQPVPTDMYELFQKYFHKGGTTIDIGCGNGRDAYWLNSNGYPCKGIDASEELVQIARELYSGIDFQVDTLPELKSVKEKYKNVVCETVIMHLEKSDVVPSVKRLKQILQPDGILYLSWRVTIDKDQRHSDGRLYSAFEPLLVTDLFEKNQILHFEDKVSLSSNKRVCRLVTRL